jgi:hypothetical protein
MKTSCFFLITVMFFSFITNAQTPVEKNKRPVKVYNGPSGHALGAALTSSNGKGLTYRYWPRKYGFHVSFIPASRNESRFYNVGLTGYAKLKEYEMGTLFLHAGAEYQYQYQSHTNSSGYPNYITSSYITKSNGLNIGAGPGFHVIQKYISMDIFLGYGAYIKDNYTTEMNSELKDELVVTFTGGIAFFLEL